MSTIIIALCIWVGISDMVTSRNAMDDICNRLPWFSACRGNSDGQSVQSTLADLPQPSSAITDRKTYCRQYQSQYTYFCTNNNPSPGQADRFCRSYSHNCDLNPTPDTSASTQSARMSPDQIHQLCEQYKSLASSYCTGQETGTVKTYCDAYRTNCVSSNVIVGHDVSQDDQSERVNYCTRYQSAYNAYCSGQRPTGRVATFCYAYKDYCGSLPQVITASRDITAAATPSPNYNNSAQVRQLCDQYSWMANRACWGFEAQDLRQYCNMYRVYCQGKDPVPSIDGSFGWNKDNWGVAGIPYYPFNQQGAIGGGTRNNIGFGDWGANFKQRSGVTDFWDQNKQVEANWQRGNYGYNRGWNIPLIGLGGYRNNDVHVGGFLNPTDLPAVSNPGVLPANGGMPQFGANAGNPSVSGGFTGPLGNILG